MKDAGILGLWKRRIHSGLETKLDRSELLCNRVLLKYIVTLQITSCEMLGWMKHKLESRFVFEIMITSDMQMIPPL